VGSVRRFSRRKLATDQSDGDCAGAESPPAVMPGVGGSFSGGWPSAMMPAHARYRVSAGKGLNSSLFVTAAVSVRLVITFFIVTLHSSQPGRTQRAPAG